MYYILLDTNTPMVLIPPRGWNRVIIEVEVLLCGTKISRTEI